MKSKLKVSVIAVFILSLLMGFSLFTACSEEVKLALKNELNTVEIDCFTDDKAEIDLPSLFTEQVQDVIYKAATSDVNLKLSEVTDGKLTVTSDGQVGTYTVSITVSKNEKQLISFDVTVVVINSAPKLSLKQEDNTVNIDLDKGDTAILDLKQLINGTAPAGTTYALSSESDLVTISRRSENDFTIVSNKKTGEAVCMAEIKYTGKTLLAFSVKVKITDSLADPTVKKATDSKVLNCVVYPDGTTEGKVVIEPSELFEAGAAITYEAEADEDVTINMAEGKIIASFVKFGVQDVKIYAVKRGERKVSSVVTVDVRKEINSQLVNGDFEQDYLNWKLTDEEKAAYAIYNTPVDIWNNPNNSTGKHLNGFEGETFAEADFVSGLFKVDGCGIITWKMGGNCVDGLQFKLMKYVEGGEDTEVAKFNNWYFAGANISGFIMQSYYYQINMNEHNGDYFYFEVIDTVADGGFAFICLDDIVTYYKERPELTDFRLASFVSAPPSLTLVSEDVEVLIEVGEGSAEINLAKLFNEIIPDNVSFSVSAASDKITLSTLSENKFTVSCVEIGAYPITVKGIFNNVEIINFEIAFEAVADIPLPVAKHETVEENVNALFFNDGSVEAEYEIAVSELFEAVSAITYSVECEDPTVNAVITDSKKLSVKVSAVGEKTLIVKALKRGVAAAQVTVVLTIDAEPTAQLVNGNFEQDYLNWKLTDEEKAAYAIYNTPVDIWNNPNNSTGKHLNGFEGETFAEADFVSGLFKVDGCGIITWKMGGNCVDGLQFKLMKYVEDGKDTEVAKFNNWYFAGANISGFIMQSYYYQINMNEHNGDYFYFEVIDTVADGGFAFICLDDIVTYYNERPELTDFHLASFVNAPPSLTAINTENVLTAESTDESVEIDISGFIAEDVSENVVLSISCESEYIELSQITNNKFTATFGGELGEYTITVQAIFNNTVILSFEIHLNVVEAIPSPTVKHERVEQNIIALFFNDGSVEAEYEIAVSELFEAVSAITYSVECEDPTVNAVITDSKKLSVKISAVGEKTLIVKALKRGVVEAQVTVVLTIDAEPAAQLVNGDFEQNYLNWKLTDEEKAAYAIYNTPVDIWNNPNNSTGKHLNGFESESFAEADFVSGLFKVDGCGIITWKMGGNCVDGLQFKLMKYVKGGEDTEVAKFNNWYFGAYAGSAFIMKSYYYQIDMSEYAGDYFYFEVIDTVDGGGFAFICLDDIVTYYAEAPSVEGHYLANFKSAPPVLTLVNEENTVLAEATDESLEIDIATLISGQIPETVALSAVCESEHIELSQIAGNKFTVTFDGELGEYTITVQAKFNNAVILSFDISLEIIEAIPSPTAKQERVEQNISALFFNDGSVEAEYEIAVSELFDAVSVITYTAECEDGSVTVKITESGKLSVSANSTGTKTVIVKALKRGVAEAQVTVVLTIDAEPTTQLVNGDFEQNYLNWKLTDEEKAAYSIYNSTVDIWNNANNSTGNQLYGFANESFAEADFVSGLFKADGSGIITWKMGGNCVDGLQFKLMKYVEGGEDIEVAKFNNWYYGAYAGSAFIMKNYYYQIDMSEYAGDYFYFEVIDTVSDGGFAFICLDDIVTYYAEAPDTTNMYAGGFKTPPTV